MQLRKWDDNHGAAMLNVECGHNTQAELLT